MPALADRLLAKAVRPRRSALRAPRVREQQLCEHVTGSHRAAACSLKAAANPGDGSVSTVADSYAVQCIPQDPPERAQFLGEHVQPN